MSYVQALFYAGVAFGQNTIGIITRPYESYRRIVDRGTSWELAYVGIVLAIYFAIASIIRTAAFRPFLLTRQFVLLYAAALLGACIIVVSLWGMSVLLGGKGSVAGLVRGWAYTLIPTACWFTVTSFVSLILPPPRTTSIFGIAFSIVFLLFSMMMFWWKLTLGYLTLRFGMRLDLGKICIVAVVTTVVLGAYSKSMYDLGIFRVPFI